MRLLNTKGLLEFSGLVLNHSGAKEDTQPLHSILLILLDRVAKIVVFATKTGRNTKESMVNNMFNMLQQRVDHEKSMSQLNKGE